MDLDWDLGTKETGGYTLGVGWHVGGVAQQEDVSAVD